ncbi:hypothetical protein KBY99_02950 [Cyanobium sp. Maggiore-St4-Cus]|nr:hypothetical protein [Cyanobium sp. Maggiore-St4-Cus]
MRPSLIQASLGDSGGRLLALPLKPPQEPSPDGGAGLLSAAAAVGEVLAMGDQALVQVAGEQRDAVRPRVMPKEMAGHTDLAAADGTEHRLIQPRPVLDLPLARGL